MGLVRGKRPALSSTLLGFFTTNRGCIHSASLSAPVVAALGSFAAVLCRTLFSSQSKGSSLLTGCQHLSIAPSLPLHLHCPNPPACTFLRWASASRGAGFPRALISMWAIHATRPRSPQLGSALVMQLLYTGGSCPLCVIVLPTASVSLQQPQWANKLKKYLHGRFVPLSSEGYVD